MVYNICTRQIVNCRLQTANWKLQIVNCKLNDTKNILIKVMWSEILPRFQASKEVRMKPGNKVDILA